MTEGDKIILANLIPTLKAEMGKQRIRQGELAQKLGVSRDSIKRLFMTGRGKRKILDLGLILGITAELGLNFAELVGNPAPSPRQENFDPRRDDPRVYVEEVEERLADSPDFFSFHHMFGIQVTTKAVQAKAHLSMFGPISETRDGNQMINCSDQVANSARNFYMAGQVRCKYLMLAGDMNKPLLRQYPYNLCTPVEVFEFYRHLREEGERRRGLEILVINQEKLQRHPDLEYLIKTVESFFVVGKDYSAVRHQDLILTCSRVPSRVDEWRALLQRTERFAEPCKLHEYEKEAERLAKTYEKGDPLEISAALERAGSLFCHKSGRQTADHEAR